MGCSSELARLWPHRAMRAWMAFGGRATRWRTIPGVSARAPSG